MEKAKGVGCGEEKLVKKTVAEEKETYMNEKKKKSEVDPEILPEPDCPQKENLSVNREVAWNTVTLGLCKSTFPILVCSDHLKLASH